MAIAERPMGTPFEDAGSPEPDEDDVAVLDAYSAAVSAVAETLIPSVASVRVTRPMGGRTAGGSDSEAVAVDTAGGARCGCGVVL